MLKAEMWNSLSDINLYEGLLAKRIAEGLPLLKREINFEKICRTCLREAPDTDNLLKDFEIGAMNFNVDNKVLKLIDMLAQSTSLLVSELDNLPHQICNNCIQNISGAYFFRVQCHKADNLLRRLCDAMNKPEINSNHESDDLIKVETDESFELKEHEEQPNLDDEGDEDTVTPNIIEICTDADEGCSGIYSEKEMCVEFDGVEYQINSEIFHVEEHPVETQEEDDEEEELMSEIEVGARSSSSYQGSLDKDDMEIRVSDDAKLQQIKIEIMNDHEEDESFTAAKESPRPLKRRGKYAKRRAKDTGQSLKETHRCETCDAQFTKVQSLKRHMKIHQTDQKNKLCSFCGKGFIRADDLTRHIRIHTGERPYACTLCPKKYKQTSELKEHMLTHSKDKTFICTICGKALQTRNGHYVHMRTHLGLKKHICELCGNRYVTSGELSSHIRHIHEKRKPFHCTMPDCNRAFGTKSSLEIHERAHTGERPYPCSYCNKRLATQSSLSDHIRIHTGTSCFKCQICNKVVITLQSLKKHLQTHETVLSEVGKMFECPVCTRCFLTLTELENHVSEHNSDSRGEQYGEDLDEEQIEAIIEPDEEDEISRDDEMYDSTTEAMLHNRLASKRVEFV